MRVRAILAFALAVLGAAACGGGSYQGFDAGGAGSSAGGSTGLASGSASGAVVNSGVAESGNVVTSGSVASGSSAAGTTSSSGSCMISASNYDQSCNVDSDCAQVSAGDYCSAMTCQCGGSAVSVGALAQFNADVSKTPLGSGALMGAICGCPCEGGAVCRSSKCQPGFCAPPPGDTLPACADAGGMCVYSTNTGCNGTRSPNLCAYSDEVCCLN